MKIIIYSFLEPIAFVSPRTSQHQGLCLEELHSCGYETNCVHDTITTLAHIPKLSLGKMLHCLYLYPFTTNILLYYTSRIFLKVCIFLIMSTLPSFSMACAVADEKYLWN